jgi:hypothetical protein
VCKLAGQLEHFGPARKKCQAKSRAPWQSGLILNWLVGVVQRHYRVVPKEVLKLALVTKFLPEPSPELAEFVGRQFQEGFFDFFFKQHIVKAHFLDNFLAK